MVWARSPGLLLGPTQTSYFFALAILTLAVAPADAASTRVGSDIPADR